MVVDAVLQENPPIVDFKQMAAAQQQDPDILKLQTSLSSLTLKACPIPMSYGKIICDMSTGVPRPIVPSLYRRQVFDSLHSHPGVRATQRLITSHFVWPTSTLMYGSGPDPVFSVKDLKYIVTPSLRSQLLLPPIIDLSKYTSIL